jgi:methylmalonyl-CoA mutase, N-terminal domain
MEAKQNGLADAQKEWDESYGGFTCKLPERKKRFCTQSDIPVKPLYVPKDVSDPDAFLNKLSFPGQYPYTRGIYPSMYRNRVWTKRQLVGFGGPEDFNKRTRMLLAAGQTGINFTASSVSMRGLDTDDMADTLHPGYVGLYGTPLDSIMDVAIALEGIPIERISTNYSDQGPFASIAMHFSVAQNRGIPFDSVIGSSNHADCISHWNSCQAYVLLPLDAHMRISVDLIKWSSRNAKKWHPLTITGQHYSQGGATPVQEVAFTLAAGIAYIEECLKAGLGIDEFAPRIGAFFDGQISIFEMAAKLRVARRMWAKILKNRFGAKNPASWQLPIHVQTSGVELTRQAPHLNIARVALQALGAVLGGCNSLHADSWDEAIHIPSEEAAMIALLTQHVLSEESGVADAIDPLGGSYYLESLTDEMEERAWKIIETIESLGGMKVATEKGWVFNEITKSTNDAMIAVNNREKIVVGVNEYIRPEEGRFESPEIDADSVKNQIERTRRVKKERDQHKAKRALDELRAVAEGKEGNIYEKVLTAIQAYCTRGEVVKCLLAVYGKPNPPCSF